MVKVARLHINWQSGIFGGHEAEPHSRPYMASLQIPTHSTCGGVLIRQDNILTAAHCLNESIPNVRAMEVVLGAHNINPKEASQQRIKVKKFLRHPLFTGLNQYDYDIMLLKLKTKAKLNKFVRVMELPKKDGSVPAEMWCWVAGWGRRAPGSQAEHLLQEVKIMNIEACKASWQTYFNTTHMTCSSSSQGKGFCQGDSGGPLVCNCEAQGIAAYTAEACTDPIYPQVYTRIYAFLPWMKKVMKGQDSEP
ncbi:mast cell protease 1A-like [Clupea harengus]|uniref:trypsin n=1 Tax=Clupea harengus TaxID=7950 RepID=A0A8M1KCK1_CLUHA|nr:mast cell protease 1A-like [Clupea harengus]